jgi:spermidine/putrescine transport system permease protein
MASAAGAAPVAVTDPTRPDPGDPDTRDPVTGRRRGRLGYLLLLPAALWLGLFFLVPFYSLVATSLFDPSGSDAKGYDMTYHVANYWEALKRYGKPEGWTDIGPLLRSLVYGGIATAICLVLGYVLAYAIAFKAGRWKNLMLVLVIAPFFTSFLVRTLSWKLILADDGFVVNTLQAVHLLGSDGRLLATPVAVVAGLTYNFLPFMVLPLFASIDKIDHRLIEAAGDLYASPARAFFKVTWPLSLPGVVSGTLLTFIPAAGDYINAQLLGNTNVSVVGWVIQLQATNANHPHIAAALSTTLMVLIVALVLVYVRRAGTEELL